VRGSSILKREGSKLHLFITEFYVKGNCTQRKQGRKTVKDFYTLFLLCADN